MGPRPFKVVTYNIRTGAGFSLAHPWSRRRRLVRHVLDQLQGDLIAVQELSPNQETDLRSSLVDHRYVGYGREAAPGRGERVGIFVRAKRFEIEDRGRFWLSASPDRPGSVGWDATCPRIATWVAVIDREDGTPLHVINAHLDHRGHESRERGARQIAEHMSGVTGRRVILGDFNDTPGSAPYARLMERGFEDACDGELQPTFHGFGASPWKARIDWILHGPELTTLSAGVHDERPDGAYPSDHDPAWAILGPS